MSRGRPRLFFKGENLLWSNLSSSSSLSSSRFYCSCVLDEQIFTNRSEDQAAHQLHRLFRARDARAVGTVWYLQALGRVRQAKGSPHSGSDAKLPAFLRAKNLKPFIPIELSATPLYIEFRTSRGSKAFGFPAELLPKVCDIFLDADEADALVSAQIHIADRAKLLMRALAHVGIIALVDEATGYQYDRARDALAQILETFIDNELQKWIKTFPDEFYKQIARLRNYKLKNINKRGSVYAQLTNYLIYRRLAPGVLIELKRITPKDAKGRRVHKYFQRLTADVGHPALRELLSNQIVLMKIFPDGDWKAFDKAMSQAIPIYGNLPLFDSIEDKDSALQINAPNPNASERLS